MIILDTKEDYENHINLLKLKGEIISLVPTMGNLHDGHLSLVEIAKKNSSKVITTIFINPLQFGKNEDFVSYPRTMNQDINKLKKYNCDILFAPKSKNEVFNNFDNLKNLKAGPKGNPAYREPPQSRTSRSSGQQPQGRSVGKAGQRQRASEDVQTLVGAFAQQPFGPQPQR